VMCYAAALHWQSVLKLSHERCCVQRRNANAAMLCVSDKSRDALHLTQPVVSTCCQKRARLRSKRKRGTLEGAKFSPCEGHHTVYTKASEKNRFFLKLLNQCMRCILFMHASIFISTDLVCLNEEFVTFVSRFLPRARGEVIG